VGKRGRKMERSVRAKEDRELCLVQYSAMGFTLIFLGEYTNILVMSMLTTLLVQGG
jgi:NADH:ubiquinone oxidoreductase subunit H